MDRDRRPRPARRGRRPGWGSAGTTVRLEPLGDADTTGLLAALLAHHGLPAEVDPDLLARVGGNPLFAEEYVRMLRDRGAATARSSGGLGLSPPDPPSAACWTAAATPGATPLSNTLGTM